MASQVLSEFLKFEDYAHHSTVFIGVNCLAVLVTLVLWKRYGECDFEKAKPNGPFAVGCREMYAAGNGAQVTVYYPVDHDTYCRSRKPRKKWLDNNEGNRWLAQLQVTRRWYDRTIKSLPSTFMFWPWREVEIHAKVDVELSEDFTSGSKLAPILFSHGFCGNRCMYSVQCSELASFGYLVFAIDHLDGSGNLTETRQQTIVKFNTSMPRD